MVIMPPKEPSGGVPLKVSNESNFGNSERQALKARALGNGNPMKYSTEAKQDSIQAEQMGGILNDVIDGAEDAVKSACYNRSDRSWYCCHLRTSTKGRTYAQRKKIRNNRAREQELRTAMTEIEFIDKLKKERSDNNVGPTKL